MKPRPMGERRTVSDGYVIVRVSAHPRAYSEYWVFEHILVAEAALGRSLSEAHPVHHVDEDRANNSGGNLVICEDKGYHALLHSRQQALDACGHPSWSKCVYANHYDDPANMAVHSYSSPLTPRYYHAACGIAARKSRAKKAAA